MFALLMLFLFCVLLYGFVKSLYDEEIQWAGIYLVLIIMWLLAVIFGG